MSESLERKTTPSTSAGAPTEDSHAPSSIGSGHSRGGPSSWPDSFAEPPLPEQIGPYRILSRIGEGGIGVVYKAEQREPVKRIVALKLIKLGMDTREVVARFAAERQALAMMDHPNVARVFDAGSTETGRPYFVMELVAGEPITDYCDRHSLTTRQRLELFVQICSAIQHAHTKGIIHRDLKPSNVLVAVKDGVPHAKVIDFGIAKAMSSRLTDRTLYTEQGQLIGTPEYMSPEQAEMSGLDIDTRADIYSLGVMLYELLAGAPPVDSKTLRRAAYAEIQRMIRELDPPSPSLRLSRMDAEQARKVAEHRRAEVTALAAELKRELEWIPLKAMRKDRTERYETAKDLATDIENYLDGRPLIAGPETQWYRTQKFVKRNKIPVAVAAVMFLLLASMLAVTLSLLRVNKERNQLLAGLLKQAQEKQQLTVQKDDAERQRAEAETRRRETEEAYAKMLASVVSSVRDPSERDRIVGLLMAQLPVGPGGVRDPGLLGPLLRLGGGLLPSRSTATSPSPLPQRNTTVPTQ